MDLKSAIDILSIHNDWRRDDTGELPQVQPKILGEAIDFVVREFKNLHLQNVSISLPDAIDKIKGYEKEALKQAEYAKRDGADISTHCSEAMAFAYKLSYQTLEGNEC